LAPRLIETRLGLPARSNRSDPKQRKSVRRGRSPHGRGYLALTFSTLLSSQGASAHRIKGLSAGHRGNSLTLPGDLPPVKRSGFGSPGLPHTDTDRSDTNRADGGGSGHRRGTGHLDRCPFLPVRRTSRTLRRSTDPSQIDIRARRSRPLFRDSSVQLEQASKGLYGRSAAPRRQRT
jgi:hypothetical protein